MDKTPLPPPSDSTRASSSNVIVENEYWGVGCATSTSVNINGTYVGNRIVTFPC